VGARIAALADRYKDGHTYTLDGFSVEYPDWHFNVRSSNTEPMIRLNLEALTPELMEAKRDEVLGLIRG
jgi:phosphomannomutase